MDSVALEFKIILFTLLLFIFCQSCKQIEYIKEIQVEYRDRYAIDTVIIQGKDSIVEKRLNDTIYIEKYKTLYKDKISIKTDSILIQDSIPYPVEITKTVTKNSKFGTFAIWWFVGSLTLILIIIILTILKYIKK